MRMTSILDTVGSTPLVRLGHLFSHVEARVWAKLEGFNPGGSAKDRPALRMIREAWQRGEIGPSTLVVEASSGNTGVALAQICARMGLRFRCLVDPTTTNAHVAVLRAYGAEVAVVDEPDVNGQYHPSKLARIAALQASGRDIYWPNQHANRANADSHRDGTMREILDDLGRAPDALFVATSTCGTLRGCMDALRKAGAKTRIFAVDAHGSRIFSDCAAPRQVPGLGAASRSPLAPDPADVQVIHVRTHDCVQGCRDLVATEAILAGASSGAVIHAMRITIPRLQPRTLCVGILPDRGERYLDTVYNEDWLPGRCPPSRDNDRFRIEATGTSS